MRHYQNQNGEEKNTIYILSLRGEEQMDRWIEIDTHRWEDPLSFVSQWPSNWGSIYDSTP